uniref:Uncharacterized protein n=1 Tax=Arundo donax TaxID=35708 RepID=A0A0A9FTD6_ARUDO
MLQKMTSNLCPAFRSFSF